ncbi:TnsA endonuclease N-terminal domain-containing protein [Paenibacillus septentrionalis]|uniref:TnsA endonuclease N-terminal domain-containing protein n=1 Tax=Paenibacillus septentrionalis TaxID=429342 RepID=A0ABW1VA68_9BACL
MSSQKYGWTEEKIARYVKDGRGQGELSNYKPWLTIQDVPSKGRSHRVMGWKTNRIHHLLSDMEFDYLCILDWVSNVLDIREQYPLDRISTLKISEELEVKHPTDLKTGTPIVMTTDFLITLREGNKIVHLARTIKPSEQLNDERIIQSLKSREYIGRNKVLIGELLQRKNFCR